MSSSSVAGNVIRGHPKLVGRWAEVYLQMYSTHGFVAAQKWFSTFLPLELQILVRQKIVEIAKERKPEDKK